MIICELISYRNYQIKLCLLKSFDDNIGNIFHFYSTLPIAITYARLEVVSILEGCNIYNEKYSRLRLSIAKFTSTFANVDLTSTWILIFWYCISSQISNNACSFAQLSFIQNLNVLGSTFLVYWSQSLFRYCWKFESLLPYSIGKQNKYVLLSCQNFCWLSFHTLSFFCKIVYGTRLLILNNFTSAVAHLTLPTHRHVFLICFLLWLFY